MMYAPSVKRLALALLGSVLAVSSCSNEGNGNNGSTTIAGATTTMGGASGVGGSTTTAGGTSSVGGSATSMGTMGGSAGTTTTGGSGGSQPEFVEPELLSETGLYEADMQTLASGVRAFHPQYPLWSDTAAKQRWVYLPPGATIDTSAMDYWNYPVGTKLFKEFSRDDVRVETRLLQKVDDGEWFMMAFQWNEEQSDATAMPDGLLDASGTDHDIPSTSQCENCHKKMEDIALGFSAVQLSHAEDGLKLDDLVAEGLLSDPPAAAIVVPGNEVERAALGYMHSNCGNCHHPRSFVSNTVDMQLWLDPAFTGSVEETASYTTSINRPSVKSLAEVGYETGGEGGAPGLESFRVVPGNPDESVLFLRVETRITAAQMPPIGTEIVDDEGVELLRAWIEGL